MGWGYFLDARLTVPAAAWAKLARVKTDAFPTKVGWWGLRDIALERRFVDAFGDTSKGMTFEKLVRSFAGDESIGRIEKAARGRVCVRIVTLLAKDMDTDVARGVAALFEAAAGEGGEGAVSLVNDGTYVGEDGVTVTLRARKLTREALSDDGGKLAASLGAVLYPDLDALEEQATASAPAAKKAKATAKAKKASSPAFAPASLRHLLAGGLDVAWQCAAGKQTLTVEIDHGVRVPLTYPIQAMRNLEGFGSSGMLGGDAFEPSIGAARARGGPKVAGTTVSWTLEVAGLCPEALPRMIEQLAIGGMVPGSEARTLRVRGSLARARGGEALYVDTARALALLRGGAAPRPWGAPPAFAWKVVPSRGRTARLTVALERPTKKATAQIDSVLANLGFFAALGASAAGDAEADASATEISGKGSEIVGTWKRLDTGRAPFVAAARNALTRAHAEGARIVRAELSLP